MALNHNAVTTVDAARTYLAQARTDATTGKLTDGFLEALVNRVSSAIADYCGRTMLVATPRHSFTANATTNVLTAAGHGLAEGDPVGVYAPASGDLPAPLAEHTLYYAVSVTSGALQLATEPAGVPVDLTSAGTGGALALVHRHVLPGDGGTNLGFYLRGLAPVVSVHSVELQGSSQLVPHRPTIAAQGWVLGDDDALAGIVRLVGYATTSDPEDAVVYARVGYDAALAAGTGYLAQAHRQALDSLEQAALYWISLLFHGPSPVDSVTVGEVTTSFRAERVPVQVRGLLDNYRIWRLPT